MHMMEEIIRNYHVSRFCIIYLILKRLGGHNKRKRAELALPYSINDKIPKQVSHLNKLIGVTDMDCLVNLRMDRNAFGRLCALFRQLGTLRDKRFVYVEEQVAIFLGILAYHKKIHLSGFDFLRSSHTISC